jgi:hypothetical protein
VCPASIFIHEAARQFVSQVGFLWRRDEVPLRSFRFRIGAPLPARPGRANLPNSHSGGSSIDVERQNPRLPAAAWDRRI